MKALFCSLNTNSDEKIGKKLAEGFRESGLQVDETDTTGLASCVGREDYLFVLTIGFEPAVSAVCREREILYFSWLLDWSMRKTVECGEAKNPFNYIFCAGQELREEVSRTVGERALYLPPAADEVHSDEQTESANEGEILDISYLAEHENERQEDIDLSALSGLREYTKGYLESLLRAQEKLSECSVLEKALNKKILSDMEKEFARNNLIPEGDEFSSRLASRVLADMVFCRERKHLLKTASEAAPVNYWGHRIPGELESEERIRFRGFPADDREKFRIYRQSRITICLMPRGPQTGFLNHIFEVMAAGGVVLANFHPELPGLFNIGVHLEVFWDGEDLTEKLRYYLSHEEERLELAANGRRLLSEIHTYAARAAEMFQMVFGGAAE